MLVVLLRSAILGHPHAEPWLLLNLGYVSAVGTLCVVHGDFPRGHASTGSGPAAEGHEAIVPRLPALHGAPLVQADGCDGAVEVELDSVARVQVRHDGGDTLLEERLEGLDDAQLVAAEVGRHALAAQRRGILRLHALLVVRLQAGLALGDAGARLARPEARALLAARLPRQLRAVGEPLVAAAERQVREVELLVHGVVGHLRALRLLGGDRPALALRLAAGNLEVHEDAAEPLREVRVHAELVQRVEVGQAVGRERLLEEPHVLELDGHVEYGDDAEALVDVVVLGRLALLGARAEELVEEVVVLLHDLEHRLARVVERLAVLAELRLDRGVIEVHRHGQLAVEPPLQLRGAVHVLQRVARLAHLVQVARVVVQRHAAQLRARPLVDEVRAGRGRHGLGAPKAEQVVRLVHAVARAEHREVVQQEAEVLRGDLQLRALLAVHALDERQLHLARLKRLGRYAPLVLHLLDALAEVNDLLLQAIVVLLADLALGQAGLHGLHGAGGTSEPPPPAARVEA
mmetsp:Transcript_9840/g.28915  ORF Transcript_9840/g.28915 Transcript_9840/m.28915 type:complete len:518 (-) Transcript_9840:57-1610(-)